MVRRSREYKLFVGDVCVLTGSYKECISAYNAFEFYFSHAKEKMAKPPVLSISFRFLN
ncbi:hypothetical protein [Dipodfec virus UOA04_Rod_862]|nr:hypothetical protein [Dipodfec virus UOA04_Rod_862]